MIVDETYDTDDLLALAAGYLRLRDAAQALIDALPKCDRCGDTATRAFERGGGRYCDTHAVVIFGDDNTATAPEYPRAAPLRALIALLEAK